MLRVNTGAPWARPLQRLEPNHPSSPEDFDSGLRSCSCPARSFCLGNAFAWTVTA